MNAPDDSGWGWWAGSNEDLFDVGPCETRDEAISEAIGSCTYNEFQNDDGRWMVEVFLCEARNEPLRLADWIDADDLLERAEDNLWDRDRVSGEFEEGPWFVATLEQAADLADRVKRACDEWQAAHGLTFNTGTFSHVRNQEELVLEHPEPEAAV